MKFRQKVRRVNDLEKERETEHGVFDLHLIEHTRGSKVREMGEKGEGSKKYKLAVVRIATGM